MRRHDSRPAHTVSVTDARTGVARSRSSTGRYAMRYALEQTAVRATDIVIECKKFMKKLCLTAV
jgi:cytidylate kinase